MIEDARSRQRRHRRAGAELLGGVAAVGILILAIGLGGAGAVHGRRSNAARRSSAIAPPGEYYYLHELAVQRAGASSSANSIQWWVANNGSGRVVESLRANGRRSSLSKTFAAGGYDSVAYPSQSQSIGHRVLFPIDSLVPLFWNFDPERLPTDPAALSHALRAGVTEAAGLERQAIYAQRNVAEATKELLLIAYALQDPMDPPVLRNALFTVARKLPGIGVRDDATDPLGRRGEAITTTEGLAVEADGQLSLSAHEMFAVIFNPKTRQILAETQYPSDHPAQAKNFYTVFTGGVDTHTATTVPNAG